MNFTSFYYDVSDVKSNITKFTELKFTLEKWRNGEFGRNEIKCGISVLDY